MLCVQLECCALNFQERVIMLHCNSAAHKRISYAFLKKWTWACDRLKTSNLSADNFKRYLTSMGQTWARDTIRWYWSVDTLFWQLSIDHNMDVQYRLAPGLPNYNHRQSVGKVAFFTSSFPSSPRPWPNVDQNVNVCARNCSVISQHWIGGTGDI